jgi:hypothetical protein
MSDDMATTAAAAALTAALGADYSGENETSWGNEAAIAVSAARPVIEADIRQRLAVEVLAERDDPRHDLAGSWMAYADAARIVLGERP